MLFTGGRVDQQQVFSAIVLFLGQGKNKFRNASHKIVTAENRKYVPAFFVVTGVGLAQRCDHVILVGLFQLLGEVVVNGLLHSLQLPMAFGLILTVRLLALEMGFQVVRPLAG